MVAHEDRQKLPRLVNEPRFGRKTNYSHQRIAFRWIDKVVTPAKYKRQRKLGSPLRHDLRHSLQSIQRNRLDLFRTLRSTTNFTRRGSVRFTQRTQMLHQIRNTTRLFPHYGEINTILLHQNSYTPERPHLKDLIKSLYSHRIHQKEGILHYRFV